MTNKIKNSLVDDAILDMALSPDAGLQLADPFLVSYYKDYNDRVLWIDKDITDSLFCEIKNIIQWNREDAKNNIPVEERKPITLIIHSYGGNLDSCFALIDVMNLSKTPIRTVNINTAMSSGCLIFINGHKGMRYTTPLSTALIHDGSGGIAQCNYSEVVAQTENYKKTVSMMKDNILKHTTIDQKTLNKWKNKDIYLYAEDQLKYNMADKLIESLDDIF